MHGDWHVFHSWLLNFGEMGEMWYHHEDTSFVLSCSFLKCSGTSTDLDLSFYFILYMIFLINHVKMIYHEFIVRTFVPHNFNDAWATPLYLVLWQNLWDNSCYFNIFQNGTPLKVYKYVQGHFNDLIIVGFLFRSLFSYWKFGWYSLVTRVTSFSFILNGMSLDLNIINSIFAGLFIQKRWLSHIWLRN